MRFCPHCGGDLSAYLAAASGMPMPEGGKPNITESVMSRGPYDQTTVWKLLMQRAAAAGSSPPATEALAMSAADRLRPLINQKPLETIVHLAFDRPVVPQGGMLHDAVLLEGRQQRSGEDLFSARGYAMEDGKVKIVDHVPVGPVYNVLEYWGGDRQHKRWHLAEPITIGTSRNGDPFFMDENMVAFGATWSDAEKLDESLVTLLDLLGDGIPGKTERIATPLVLEVLPRSA